MSNPGDYMKKLTAMLPAIYEATHSLDGWDSLIINRRKPYTYRIWRQFGDERVCLHRFDECERGEAFLHPHPWPAAFLILSGGYYQTIGRSHDLFDDPDRVAEFKLVKGAMYEITCPQAWHAIEPYDTTCTVMVNGPPFTNPHASVRTTKGKDLEKLKDHEILMSLHLFRQLIRPFVGEQYKDGVGAIKDLMDDLEKMDEKPAISVESGKIPDWAQKNINKALKG